MAKDLREFLEYPMASSAGRRSMDSAPLAHRRSVSSPGEPRVFKVKSGFVCGLCGRMHEVLDQAFECLGRCIFELRLRSAAGATHSGSQTRFACTACGRGFVNCEDAEQCFERCLIRMKPTPLFEKALRKVQVRYSQRFASHGVRALERIDPLSEHKKILTLITKEQEALGRGAGETETVGIQQIAAQNKEASVNDFEERSQDVEPRSSTAEQSRPQNPVREEQIGVHAQALRHAQSTQPAQTTQPNLLSEEFSEPSTASTVVEDQGEILGFESQKNSEHESEENLIQESSIGSTQPDSSQSSESTQDISDDFSSMIGSEENATIRVGLQEQENLASAQSRAMNGTPESLDPMAELGGLDSVSESSNNSHLDALNSLSSALDLKENEFEMTPAVKQSGLAESLAFMNDDTFGNALEDASAFASTAQQPDLPEEDGQDVFAMLQTPPEGEDLKLNEKHEELLQGSSLSIDSGILDNLSNEEEPHIDATSVFFRKPDMKKSYRRNNAKYCCSACGKEYFTKEQVDVCFYSHPEEGSNEAQVLLHKANKNRTKSVA